MQPLAAALRPDSLESFVGQEHLVGPGKPLRIALEQDHIFSLIFWGPPGVGKTTLTRIIAEKSQRDLYELSAVSAGKKQVREIIDRAREQQKTLLESPAAPILFIDEIHRFNKAQQDFLLPYVEDGTVVLIGATTENPSFEVIPALLSRCRVFTLKQLTEEDLGQMLHAAIEHLQREYKTKLKLTAETKEWLIRYANGDGRKLLTTIDNTFQLYGNLSLDSIKATLESTNISYDKAGEEHYNTISAFIKSMRASSPDAALYYLARMVEAGEDPKFIARRMVIFASEDIGLAQPTALVVANEVFRACETIGYPECAINLAHGVAYLANAPKDRRAYDGLRAAQRDVRQFGNLPIPLALRNAPTQLMKDEGYGKEYEAYPDDKSKLLPTKLKGKRYLERPTSK